MRAVDKKKSNPIPLRLATVNIEADKHLDLVRAFLLKHTPQVVCLQEVFLASITKIANELRMHLFFTTTGYNDRNGESHPYGIAILSTNPFVQKHDYCYAGDAINLPTRLPGGPDTNWSNRTVQFVQILHDGHIFQIANTHLTWTPNGSVTELQMEDLERLMQYTKLMTHTVICGDFNAPRGKAAWQRICDDLTDNIPSEATTTLDGNIHRAGPLPYVVDGMFSSPHYQIENVKIHDGVSDHCAVTGEVYRKEEAISKPEKKENWQEKARKLLG
jgi:endonuclease/exonuclease/phosphatase family metal-dependent hydrolase